MGAKNRNYSTDHTFYCVNCGQKGIPIARSLSLQKGEGHRKRMYCYHCKHTVNHVECRDYDEEQQFISDFTAGKYLKEAADELEFERANPRLSTLCNVRTAGFR